MLKLRIMTAVVLAAVALWATYGWPTILFALFLLLATYCCAFEWSSLLNIETMLARLGYAAAVTVVTALVLWLGSTGLMRALSLTAVLCWIAMLIDLMLRPVIARVSDVRAGMGVLATFVLLVSVVALFWIREHHSAHMIVYVIMLVAAADIGAYFAGRRFGRRKLAEQISAGKTIEGAIGGIVLAVVFSVIVLWLYPPGNGSILSLLFFSLVAALYSIAGDLYISRAKRTRGVKDSGQLLPGHGGVLDRFDGLLAAVPWMFFALLWV